MSVRMYLVKHKDKGVCWWDFVREYRFEDEHEEWEHAARISKIENSMTWFEVEFTQTPPAPLRQVMRFRSMDDAKKALLSYFAPGLFDGGVHTVPQAPEPVETYHKVYHKEPPRPRHCYFGVQFSD